MREKEEAWLRRSAVNRSASIKEGNEDEEDVNGGAPAAEIDDASDHSDDEEDEALRNMDAMVSAPVTMEDIEATAHRARMIIEPTGFISKPEQSTVKLESADEFILLATANVFTNLSHQQACDVVSSHLKEHSRDAQGAAEALTKHASKDLTSSDVGMGAAVILLKE
jgi:hypothetical protein